MRVHDGCTGLYVRDRADRRVHDDRVTRGPRG
ncbi:hypothetical protein HDC93_002422 [Streptomyces sp. AK010]|nr:hypothetical protein [Streptomyces sp. AK010]